MREKIELKKIYDHFLFVYTLEVNELVRGNEREVELSFERGKHCLLFGNLKRKTKRGKKMNELI